MEAFWQDVRFGLRSLLTRPGFTIVAVSCMALGIAANVFVYSPVNAIMVRPLPYREPHHLMHVNTWREGTARRNYASWSYLDYRDVAAEAGLFQEAGATRLADWNLGGIEEPERVAGARVTPSLFPMLGLRPALGRFFRPDEEADGKVAVVGHGLWQRRFGGDSSVIGRAITLNGAPYTVIGVMAEGVRYPEVEDLWLPLEPTVAMRERRDQRNLQVVARLAPGTSMKQANLRLAAFMSVLAAKYPLSNRGMTGWMQELREDVAGEVRPIFLTMVGAVLFVLLIACSNVANLLLARGTARQRELAVRLSLGSGRWRLVRQLLTESLLLAAMGGVIGVVGGTWAVDAFTTRMLPSNVPFWMSFDVDHSVLLATLGITVASGMLFGVVPALHLTRPNLSMMLRDGGGRGGSAGAGVGRIRSALVVTQLSLSLVLLVGAALMVQSFLRASTARLGLDPRNVLTANLALAGERYASDTARAEALRLLVERARSLPGVTGAALTAWLPIGGCCSSRPVVAAGKSFEPAEAPLALFNGVSPGFFETFRVNLVAGRSFTEADGIGAARVAVVSDALAQREWPGRSAIGQQFSHAVGDTVMVTVVGVVADVVARKLGDGISPAQVYIPLVQGPWSGATLVVRGSADPHVLIPPLREAVRSIDPDLPLARVMSMPDVVRDRMFEGRVYGSMFAIFGAAALLLASIGLYGVMSYVAAQRTREVGVRIALGAQRGDVLRLIVGGGTRMLVAGVLIGVPAALGLAQLLRGSLYGVTATDPATFVGIPLLLSAVALVASLIPARRSARVDPAVAMRAE